MYTLGGGGGKRKRFYTRFVGRFQPGESKQTIADATTIVSSLLVPRPAIGSVFLSLSEATSWQQTTITSKRKGNEETGKAVDSTFFGFVFTAQTTQSSSVPAIWLCDVKTEI